MSNLTLRRSLVVLATVASIFGGAVAIRAAAGWTASAAPLAAPVDPATLVAQLQNEKARADAITQELSQVVERAAELQSALAAAEGKADSDAKAASGLAAQLAAAQKRLATLEQQMKVQGSSPSGTSSGSETPQPRETEHEEEDD
ncbi:MAG: hypothetical protein M3P32_01260 [Chloroflexota bacterium]|nr:hypothetical protein [Chloroflexota bacterium]